MNYREKLLAVSHSLRAMAQAPGVEHLAQAPEAVQLRAAAVVMRESADSIDGAVRCLQSLEIAAGWTPADEPPQGPEHAIAVLGIVDDENLRVNGEEPFVDVVHYWPAERRWTVTHCTRAGSSAVDYPCNVVGWTPIPAVPPRGSVWR